MSDDENNFKQRGLPSKIKVLIANMIDKEGMMHAQNCHLKLSKIVKKNGTNT